MTQAGKKYYNQEVEMCRNRVALGNGDAYTYTGNPMTTEQAEEHLKRTRDFINSHLELYQDA